MINALIDQALEPVRKFLKKRHIRSELKRLRASGELDQILHDANYKVIYGDQGSDYLDVYHKENVSRGAELFSVLVVDRDEAVWWIVQRHRAEQGKTKP